LLEKLGFSDFYHDAVHRGQKKGMGALLTKVAGLLEAETEASSSSPACQPAGGQASASLQQSTITIRSVVRAAAAVSVNI
jgi:hypothetical protein